MKKEFHQVAINELDQVAKTLLTMISEVKVVVFYGFMGAGKTTLIRSICKAIEIEGYSSSPTFSIVNEYQTIHGETIFHFDFYRLKSEIEAYDMGYEDYFYNGNLCLIEWPQKIKGLIPENSLEVYISGVGDKRDIKIIS